TDVGRAIVPRGSPFVAHAHRRRTRDRTSDRAACPPAGARPPFGAARGALSHQEARADHGAARRGDANRARKNRDLSGVRQYRHPESLHRLHRYAATIVAVADVADLWALERAHAVNARYHVLGGTLSPLDGIGPQDLSIDALVSRAHDPAVTEVILALNATVDGQTTAHYITDLLHGANGMVTRLAHAGPGGREVDYLDEGTLGGAIRHRTTF